MQVKTFEAFSMKDAIKAVKSEFGADAVILKTREKAMEGSKGRVVEVTAAMAASARHAGATSISESSVDELLERDRQLRHVESKLNAMADSMASRELVNCLEAGLAELKSLLLLSLRDKDGSAFKGLSPTVARLVRELQLAGVDEARLVELVRYFESIKFEDKASEDDEFETYRDHAIRWLMKRVKIAPRAASMSGASSVQAFVGATGVGKTSTVAKLAAYHHLKEKKSVVIISFDQSRLAAAEQLRVYAKVIGIPFEAASDPKDLERLIEKHSDVDLILIDSAGRSPKGSNHLSDLVALKSLSAAVDFHLVLSLTDRETQLDRSVRCFSPLGLQSLVFTKLDETWSYGDIFNLSSRWGLPLSYFGTGQKVPEEMERATRERVVERIFGL